METKGFEKPFANKMQYLSNTAVAALYTVAGGTLVGVEQNMTGLDK
jgi:hypothetical protein